MNLMIVVILVHTLVWTLAPSIANRTVPLDVAEGYAWGHEWVLATYKHPALPSWLLEISRRLTGAVGWPAYLISQLFVAVTFVCVYALGRELTDKDRAVAGVLLLSGVAFYAWPTVEFNHNIAQMPFWAALPLLLWKAIERKRGGWWLAFGIVAGMSLYAKLSSIIFLVTLAGWALTDATARAQLRSPWPWAGVVSAALIASPLALWLLQNEFAPLTYAASRASREGNGVFPFLGSEILNVGGVGILLVLAGLWRPSWARVPPSADLDQRRWRFLFVIALGPTCVALVGALITGSGLRSAWGSAMFNYVGLLALHLAGTRVSDTALSRLVKLVITLTIAIPLGYAIVVQAGPFRRGLPMRVNWPQDQIAQRFEEIWDRETGAPLKLVGGSAWVSNLIALTARGRPSVYTGQKPGDAPWVTRERLERDGALFVWESRRAEVPPLARPYVTAFEVREESFAADRWLRGPPIVIRYVVVPPRR